MVRVHTVGNVLRRRSRGNGYVGIGYTKLSKEVEKLRERILHRQFEEAKASKSTRAELLHKIINHFLTERRPRVNQLNIPPY
ncbi:uncharacterized protein G2W53_007209 [Senna tora]|uniref:Uncharacterized protein n=1 Tax=Senna tora TaxID=362788 RepID=A0A835CH45_9FABA|nr:uncharacterized protein G2W53_007209 [Senna tora]